MVRVRIAPSPTGDPHVGTAYMSLFNVAFARQQGGQFVLRIEDTDRQRYVERSEQQIYDSLRWLGLTWDEGPDKGGPYSPYRQSERLPLYQEHARLLIDAGRAYECWCTPERLAEVRAEQQRQKLPPRYDRFCLGKTRNERSGEPGFAEKPVVRLLVPDNPPLEFDDLIHGRIGAPLPMDTVLLKSDGFPTYHLGVVVDDHFMRITHVTRGEEWISSTPIHLLLYEGFGWEAPKFAHFPLLRNTDKSKISKRKNPAARLVWFMEQGYLPEALLNFLALMGWSMPDGRETFGLDDLAEHFAWERFSPVGPVFDVVKLDWLNGQYVQGLSDEEFLRRARPFLPTEPSPEQERGLRVLAQDLKERTKKLSELPEQVEFLFGDALEVDAALLTKQSKDPALGAEMLRVAAESLNGLEVFDRGGVERALAATEESRGWNKRAFRMSIRVAVTGKTVSPPIDATIAALGRERTVQRLSDAARRLQ